MSTGLQRAHGNLISDAFRANFQSYVSETDFKLSPTTTTGTPAAGFFHSNVSNRSSIPDLTKDLRASFGVDRINTRQLFEIPNEAGPNGEIVFGVPGDDRGLIRLAGSWLVENDVFGPTLLAPTPGSFVEITFFGTGLNYLTLVDTTSRDIKASIDGTENPTDIYTEGSSTLNGRKYPTNQIINVANGLSLGIHTVKLRLNSGANIRLYGFEVINASANIYINPGNAHIDGLKTSLATSASLAFNSDFENGTLGNSGGRAIVYMTNHGALTKSVTPVPDTSSTELITNGTFNTDIIGWSGLNGTASWSNDGTLISDSGSTYWDAYQTVTGLTIGKVYTFKASYNRSAGATVALRIRDTANTIITTFVPSHASANSGVNQAQIVGQWVATATSAKFGFYFDRTVVSTCKWDNATLKEEGFNVLSLTNHSNEELIRSYHFREFGSGRSDDFSTMTGTTTSRAFTLDDGTTTLVANNCGSFSTGTLGGIEGLNPHNTAGAFFTLTFVGTGIDLLNVLPAGAGYDIFVDGTNIATNNATLFSTTGIKKIASGLPYGTHTLKIAFNGATGGGVVFGKFNVYGPKKPTLPVDSIELADYYIMANFSANTSATLEAISLGVLRKAAHREFIYVNGTGGTLDWAVSGMSPSTDIGGNNFNTNRQNAYLEYIFFGTGFDFRFPTSNVGSANIQVSLQALSAGGALQNLTTANFPTISSSVYGTGVAFNSSTGILDQLEASPTLGNGFRISGLPLGSYKVRLLNNTASSYLLASAIDIITPVHAPKYSDYSWQNTGPVGSCSLSDSRKVTALKKTDTRVKAFAQAFGITQNPTTTSGAFVAVPDMSVTLRLDEAADVEIFYSITTSATGNDQAFQIQVNGAQVGMPKDTQTANRTTTSDSVIVSLPAGIHKIDLLWQIAGGNTITATFNYRTLIAKER